jgi:hypothetical protein
MQLTRKRIGYVVIYGTREDLIDILLTRLLTHNFCKPLQNGARAQKGAVQSPGGLRWDERQL